jgi:hypothetical protein
VKDIMLCVWMMCVLCAVLIFVAVSTSSVSAEKNKSFVKDQMTSRFTLTLERHHIIGIGRAVHLMQIHSRIRMRD